MTRIRVGIDARTCLAPRPRGEGKSVLRLYQEVAAIRPHWELVFYGDQRKASRPPSLPPGKMTSFELPGFRFSTWENLGLPTRAFLDRVSLLHCTSSSAPVFAPKPLVVTVHDVIPLLYPDGWRADAIGKFRTTLARAVRNARAVIAPSTNTRDDMVRLLDVPADRVYVIPWGTDPGPATSSLWESGRVLKKLGIDGPFVLAFGGGARRKNTELVLRGFASVATRVREVGLVLVGLNTPELRTRYSALADELGLSARLNILDYVDEAVLEVLYERAMGLVYLSSYEGFGLPVLEAMARGVPVIASDTSSIPEVAGDAALLFNPAEPEAWTSALVELCRSAELREKMAQQGRLRAAQFSWRTTGQSTVSLFERVMSAP